MHALAVAAGGGASHTWEVLGAVAGAIVAGVAIGPRIERFLARAGIRSTATSTIGIYEENNKALKEQNELRLAEIRELERQREADKRIIDEQTRRLDAQQEQIKTLRELVLQVKGLSELRDQLTSHHAEITEQIRKAAVAMNDQLDETAEQILQAMRKGS